MRVLWISITPSLYDEQKTGGWIASLEGAIHKYAENIELGVAFEYPEQRDKVKKNGTTYYPIKIEGSKLKLKYDFDYYWSLLREKLNKVVQDFKPDIIHCFGSEWPYAAIVNDVKIPVVVHMQGFANIYDYSESLVFTGYDYLKGKNFSPRGLLSYILKKKYYESRDRFERKLMKDNRFFMGRTEWDRNIVKYFSPNAKYFHCDEVIRPEIYDSKEHWKYDEKKDKFRLITITQASPLKGNEMILETAKLLKEQFGFSFEWNVAGRPDQFMSDERKIGIKHEDVNVNLLGMINVEKVAEELLKADIYVHPSIIDNSPNSLCEAQLLGCPVIAANVGGVKDIVENGNAGLLYPYNEPHTLAFNIMNLSAEPETLKKMSDAEKKVSHERHDPQRIVEKLMKIYEQCSGK